MDAKRIAAVQNIVDSLHEASRRIDALDEIPELQQLQAQLSSLQLIIEQNAEMLEGRVSGERLILDKQRGDKSQC